MPTLKQKAVAKKLLENPGLAIGPVMREVGYSENSAVDPSKNLLQTKGWQELMEEYLPDVDLVKVHKEGLAATRIHTSHTEPDRVVADHPTRHRYLETAYKLKKYIGADNGGPATVNFIAIAQQQRDKYRE